MTEEQLNKATELSTKIRELDNTLSVLKNGQLALLFTAPKEDGKPEMVRIPKHEFMIGVYEQDDEFARCANEIVSRYIGIIEEQKASVINEFKSI